MLWSAEDAAAPAVRSPRKSGTPCAYVSQTFQAIQCRDFEQTLSDLLTLYCATDTTCSLLLLAQLLLMSLHALQRGIRRHLLVLDHSVRPILGIAGSSFIDTLGMCCASWCSLLLCAAGVHSKIALASCPAETVALLLLRNHAPASCQTSHYPEDVSGVIDGAYRSCKWS